MEYSHWSPFPRPGSCLLACALSCLICAAVGGVSSLRCACLHSGRPRGRHAAAANAVWLGHHPPHVPHEFLLPGRVHGLHQADHIQHPVGHHHLPHGHCHAHPRWEHGDHPHSHPTATHGAALPHVAPLDQPQCGRVCSFPQGPLLEGRPILPTTGRVPLTEMPDLWGHLRPAFCCLDLSLGRYAVSSSTH
jgi:hypothetical protein